MKNQGWDVLKTRLEKTETSSQGWVKVKEQGLNINQEWTQEIRQDNRQGREKVKTQGFLPIGF